MWTADNRPRYNRDKLRYPSDLTDAEWAHIEPLIPPHHQSRFSAPAASRICRPKWKLKCREIISSECEKLATMPAS